MLIIYYFCFTLGYNQSIMSYALKSLIQSTNEGNDKKIISIYDGLSIKEKRDIKLMLANQICNDVWEKYMGTFERALDTAFISKTQDTY